MGGIIYQSSLQRFKNLSWRQKTPLGKILSWFGTRISTEILSKVLTLSIYKSLILRYLLVILFSLLIGFFTNFTFSILNINSNILLTSTIPLGFLAGFLSGGIGGGIIGILLSWLIGTIFDASLSEFLNTKLQIIIIKPISWLLSVFGGWLIGLLFINLTQQLVFRFYKLSRILAKSILILMAIICYYLLLQFSLYIIKNYFVIKCYLTWRNIIYLFSILTSIASWIFTYYLYYIYVEPIKSIFYDYSYVIKYNYEISKFRHFCYKHKIIFLFLSYYLTLFLIIYILYYTIIKYYI